MKTATHNRNEAFAAIAAKLPEKRQRVFQYIIRQPNITAQELAQKTMLPINEITGRITELKNAYLIVETGSKKNRYSNKQNTAYRVVRSVSERIDLINAAFIQLRDEQEKLERDYHAGISTFSLALIDKELIKIRSKQIALERILEQFDTETI